MTRERAFGWLSSVALQALALGALGVSPLWNYDDLPAPHNAIPIRNYVPVIEMPKAPVAPLRAPAGKVRNPVPRVTEFIFSPVVSNEILPEPGLFEEERVGVPLGIPGAVAGGPAPEIRLAPTPPEPVRVGGNVTAPRKRHHVNPIYPPVALTARVQGTVELEATIDGYGNVVNVRVLLSIPLLDGAALQAVRHGSTNQLSSTGARFRS